MVSKFPSFMNVVGSTAVAFTVTIFTPLAGMATVVKNPALAVGSTEVVPR